MNVCRVDDECGRPARAWGMCQMHWSRWRKSGDPYWIEPKGKPFKYAPTCSVDGCEKPHHARSFCTKHLARFQKHGDPLNEGTRDGRPPLGGVTGYDGAHKRIVRARGRASELPCTQCGASAREWAYSGGDPNELVSSAAHKTYRGLTYSLDPSFYEPRCIPCHRHFDGSVDALTRHRDPLTGRGTKALANVIDPTQPNKETP